MSGAAQTAYNAFNTIPSARIPYLLGMNRVMDFVCQRRKMKNSQSMLLIVKDKRNGDEEDVVEGYLSIIMQEDLLYDILWDPSLGPSIEEGKKPQSLSVVLEKKEKGISIEIEKDWKREHFFNLRHIVYWDVEKHNAEHLKFPFFVLLLNKAPMTLTSNLTKSQNEKIIE
ncbi:hypothetical protein ACJX0J_020382, partial [Zea mays]